VRVHVGATKAAVHGRFIPMSHQGGASADTISWSKGRDKYGEVTEIRLPARKQLDLSPQLAITQPGDSPRRDWFA
jgi:hypothetical protein